MSIASNIQSSALKTIYVVNPRNAQVLEIAFQRFVVSVLKVELDLHVICVQTHITKTLPLELFLLPLDLQPAFSVLKGNGVTPPPNLSSPQIHSLHARIVQRAHTGQTKDSLL